MLDERRAMAVEMKAFRMATCLCALFICSLYLAGCGDDSGSSSPAAPSLPFTLADLKLEGVTLDQIFQPNQTTYTANAGFLLASTLVKASSNDAGVTVRVNGTLSDSSGIDVPLIVGVNLIEIELTGPGAVTVFYTVTITRETSGQLAQAAYIKASNTNADDVFGVYSIALSGDTLVVGAFREDSAASGINGNQGDNSALDSGAVYVFTRDGANVWSQQAYIKASNTDAGDTFGWSVSLEGDMLAVGATHEQSASSGIDGSQSDNSMVKAGAVYIFTRDGAGLWSQQAYIKASNPGLDDAFGHSVSLSGDTLAVGAYQEASTATGIDGNQSNNSAADAGAAYVFVNNAGTWTQQAYIKASNTNVQDNFGRMLSLSGDTLAVGARLEGGLSTGINGNQTQSGDQGFRSGAVYVYTRDGVGIWSQQAYIKASNTGYNDRFGISLALDADTLAVGAFHESSDATGIDGNQSNNNVSKSGAIYVFTRNGGGVWSQQAYIKASNTGMDDIFGTVALSGDRLAVGANYEDSAATGVNGNQGDNSALDSGAAYLYIRDGVGIWSQQAYVKASNAEAGDSLGYSVALSGDTFAVGAHREGSAATGVDGNQSDNSASASGAVYVIN
jgi:hypothetical protein